METKTFRNTTYTVTGQRRHRLNDRTEYLLDGPNGAKYTLMEFDGGQRNLTNLTTGESSEWYDRTTEIVAEMEAEGAREEVQEAAGLRASLAEWNRITEKLMEKRAAIAPGTATKARIRSVTVDWARACEVRDRVAQKLFTLTGEVE